MASFILQLNLFKFSFLITFPGAPHLALWTNIYFMRARSVPAVTSLCTVEMWFSCVSLRMLAQLDGRRDCKHMQERHTIKAYSFQYRYFKLHKCYVGCIHFAIRLIFGRPRNRVLVLSSEKVFGALDDRTIAFVTTQVSWDFANCWFVNSYKRFGKVVAPLSPQSSSSRIVRIFILNCLILKIKALIA